LKTPLSVFLLCANKNDMVVKYALPEHNQQFFAPKYQLHLPPESQLQAEVRKELDKFSEEE